MVFMMMKSAKRAMKCHCSKETCQRNRSPTKNAAFLVLASITKSVLKFQLRLRRIVAKLSNLKTTPKKHNDYKVSKNVQCQELEEELKLYEEIEDCKDSSFDDNGHEEEHKSYGVVEELSFHNIVLPPLSSQRKKTIFLDLDETLIHSMSDPPTTQKFDFIVSPRIDDVVMEFYVLKRPGVDELLMSLARKFEVVIFTAGVKDYASLVIDKLDKNGLISHRLYRDSCTQVEGVFVKDLSETGRDLSKAVIVDDNPYSYLFHQSNAIPISSFINDPNDRELWKLMKFFENFDCFDDTRDAVRYYIDEEEKENCKSLYS